VQQLNSNKTIQMERFLMENSINHLCHVVTLAASAKLETIFSGLHDAVIVVGDALRDLIERHDRAGKVDCHSDIRNRGHRSSRTDCLRSHSNRMGNRRNRNHHNIRTDSPSPTIPESRSPR
jgi:hypothetical protein